MLHTKMLKRSHKRQNVFATLFCIALVACQSASESEHNNTASQVLEKQVASEIVPIPKNEGTGYSWHEHLNSAKQNVRPENIYNQASNMIELLNQSPTYGVVIETVQELTNSAEKWVVYQNWANEKSAKVRFTLLTDSGWEVGEISRTGEIIKLPNASFTDATFNELHALHLMKCTPNTIHINTLSISVGGSESQRDYNYYDESTFENGVHKCANEKSSRDLLNNTAVLLGEL